MLPVLLKDMSVTDFDYNKARYNFAVLKTDRTNVENTALNIPDE